MADQVSASAHGDTSCHPAYGGSLPTHQHRLPPGSLCTPRRREAAPAARSASALPPAPEGQHVSPCQHVTCRCAAAWQARQRQTREAQQIGAAFQGATGLSSFPGAYWGGQPCCSTAAHLAVARNVWDVLEQGNHHAARRGQRTAIALSSCSEAAQTRGGGQRICMLAAPSALATGRKQAGNKEHGTGRKQAGNEEASRQETRKQAGRKQGSKRAGSSAQQPTRT